MSIPTKFDGDLAAIDNAASSILSLTRTMQHAAAKDVPAMRKRLRTMLQEYANMVMATARK